MSQIKNFNNVTSGLNNFIDSIHDRLELLNSRIFLINTLGKFELQSTQNEMIYLAKIRNRLIEIDKPEEMISFLNSIPDTYIDSKIREIINRELSKT